MIDIIIDTLFDCLKLIPFLFFAFLIIELVEHKLNNKTKKIISKSGKIGPFIGGFFGLFPQCGFSAMATNLYITRIINLGTLISIYLATSDEMIPILLSEKVEISLIVKILVIKFIVAVVFGFIISLFVSKIKVNQNINCDICAEENCNCDNGVVLSAIKHTLNTLIFIFIITFILNILFEYVGNNYLSKIFLNNSIFGPFVSSLIGLIPNCGASIVITELYLKHAITFSSMISGLLTGSGVAILLLFKYNKNLKENIKILSILYLIGVFVGIILELLKFTI